MSDRISEEAIKRLLRQIIANDRTPEYDYGKRSPDYLNAEGKAPEVGKRWTTPREMARYRLAELEGSE